MYSDVMCKSSIDNDLKYFLVHNFMVQAGWNIFY